MKDECIKNALKIFTYEKVKIELREPTHGHSHTILFYSSNTNVSAKIEFLDKNAHFELEKCENSEVDFNVEYDATFGTKVHYLIAIIKKYKKIIKMCKTLENGEIPREFIIKTLL